jgi:hypothetical protein
MSTNFKTLLSLTAFAAFFVSTAAMADYRDYNDKAWNAIYKREHSAAAPRSFRSAAPVIVKSEAVPATVAQAPAKDSGAPKVAQAAPKAATSNRSFSYEPATSAPAVSRGRSSSASGFSVDVGRRAKGY